MFLNCVQAEIQVIVFKYEQKLNLYVQTSKD